MIVGNKENNKKAPHDTITSASGPKMTLKAREFARDITNASSSNANSGALSSKHTHTTNRVLIDNSYNGMGGHSGANSSVNAGNGSFS